MKHAKGYTQYAKSYGERYHKIEPVVIEGVLSCAVCTYPIIQPTQRTADICYESASSKHIWQPLKFGEVCIACGKCR